MGYVPGSVNSHVRSQRLLGQARAAAPALARQVVMTPRHQPSAASFDALHESAFRTSRRLAAVPNFGRDRVKADMPPGWQAYRSDENDPERTLAEPNSRTAASP
jgi:hypothetical protein